MHLDRLLVGDLLLDKERLDSLALVALELEHLRTGLLVLEHGAVAAMLLLDCLLDLLEIELGRKTGHCRDTLAAVALLDTDVHFALFQARVTSIQCSGCVLEGVCIIPDM